MLPKEYQEKGIYRYTYDLAGRKLSTTAPDGTLLEQNTYDTTGRLVRQLEGATFGYDLAGRQVKITTPEGNSQQFAYDAMGNMTATTDGMGNTTAFTVDEWGRITHIKKADGSRERYTYDHAGNLLSATDGEEHTVTYRYNCRGLQASRTDAAGNTDHFRYDREGNLAESRDRNGNVLHYTYNMYGSMTSRRSQSGDINESFGYYPDGKLKTAIGGGMRYDYRYDVMGRLSEKSASGRTLLKYGYDLNGNQTSIMDVTGKTTEYRYDALGRITEVIDNGKRQALYTYNPDGTIKTLEIGEKGILHTEYGYDTDGNLTRLKTFIKGGATSLIDNQYHYDKAGNCISKQTLGGEINYTYDSLYQLTKVIYPHGIEQYTYDKAGNRLSLTTGSKREEYLYDKNGRLTTRSIYALLQNVEHPQCPTEMLPEKIYQYSYDKQGNTLSDGENSYCYDSGNRVSQVITKSGDVQKNHYDGERLRFELEENGKVVQFLYDGDKVVSETDEDQNTVRYIRGYELISSDSEKARTYYHYASDELGSITHVIDEEGNILNRYEYDTFGNFTVKEETVANRFGFTGEIYDSLTGQYYLRARFYNPAIGRFLQEDTYYGDGLNLYTYCHSNPVGYVDPSGNMCDQKLQKRKQEYQDNGLSEHEADIMANYDRLLEDVSKEEALKYLKENGVTIEVDTYYNMKNGTNEMKVQIHHLNQDAAFGEKANNRILKDEGYSVALYGHATGDIDSQHYLVHEYMEQFWQPYRKGGKFEDNPVLLTDYNKALNASLKYAGFSDMDAAYATSRAIRQQQDKQIMTYVPRVPGRMHQKKR